MHPSRIAIAVAVVAMTVIVASAAVFATLLLAVGTCDGDGGFPYSAANSTAGRFCDSSAAGPYFVVEALLPTLCLILLGVLAWVQRSWVRLVQGAVVAVVIAVAMAAVVLELPSACPNPTSTQPECQTY